jgi:hypothetical protein
MLDTMAIYCWKIQPINEVIMIVKWSSYFLVFALVLYWGKWCFAVPMDSEMQKKAIATAHIVYLHAYGQNRAEPFCKPLTPSQVSEIVNLVDYSDSPKSISKIDQRIICNGCSLFLNSFFVWCLKIRCFSKSVLSQLPRC